MPTSTGIVTHRVLQGLALGATALVLSACNVSFGNDAEAHDQWKRTYTLANPGTLEIRDTNGSIDVVPGAGDAVTLVVDRTVRAGTEQAAKTALEQIEFVEHVTPDRIAIDSSNYSSSLFGKSHKFVYHVTVPTWAGVRVDATNGDIKVTNIGGPFRVHATNGRITGTGLRAGASVSTTHGVTSLEFASLGDNDITCETTNGEIKLAIPPDAKARLVATVTNGAITTSGLPMATTEQTRRRLEGTIGGGGGPMIKLSATNGRLAIEGR
jgi:hypothetical protein